MAARSSFETPRDLPVIGTARPSSVSFRGNRSASVAFIPSSRLFEGRIVSSLLRGGAKVANVFNDDSRFCPLLRLLLPEIFHSPLIHESRELNTCALNCRQALDRFGSRGSIRLRASIRFWRYCRGGEGEGSCFVDKEKLVEFSSVEF